MFFGAATLEPANVDHLTNPPPPAERPLVLWCGSVQAVTDTLLQALRRSPYLPGERFSAADLFVGAQSAFGVGSQCPQPMPEFEDYLARITDRHANKRFEAQAAQWAADMEARKEA